MALPKLTDLVFQLSADSIAQANNTAVATWTDSIGSVAATASGTAQPTFITNGISGKSAVRFNGTTNTMALGRPAAVVAAIDSQVYSVVVVAKANGVNTFGAAFSCWNTNGLLMLADGATTGSIHNSQSVPLTLGTFATSGFTSQGTPAWNADVAGISRTYVNGGCVIGGNVKGPVSSGNNFSVGSNPLGAQFANADIFEIMVWKVALTPAEMYEVEKWVCDKYTQVYPWTSVPYITAHDGDSISTDYLLNDPTKSYPYKAAIARSLSYGQWTSLGIPGQKMSLMTLKSAEFSAIPTITGRAMRVAAWEYANERGTAPATLQTALVNYCNAVRAFTNTKLILGTSTSTSSDPDANRTTYNNYIVANSALLCDARVDLHLNTFIGISGAAATDNNTTYFVDQLHLKDAGHTIQATLFNAGIQSIAVSFVSPLSISNNSGSVVGGVTWAALQESFGSATAKSGVWMMAEKGTTDRRHFILNFTGLSNIPAVATITSASLQLTASNGSSQAKSLSLYKLLVPNEPNASWVNRVGNTPWTSDGGKNATDIDTTPLATVVSAADGTTYGPFSSAALAALVQGWVNGSIPNYGIMGAITDEATSPNLWTWFGTPDQPTGGPVLTVTYTTSSSSGPVSSTIRFAQSSRHTFGMRR